MPTPATDRRLPRLAFGAALVLLRVPFYLTRHVQEDAYITMRCAKTLADTGVYGFNAGERVSASTSHLYVALCAALRLVFGDSFVEAALVADTVLFVIGAYLLAAALTTTPRRRYALWLLAAASPVALVISYCGMETSLLVFALGVAVHGLVTSRRALLAGALLAMPFIRPDAVAVCALLCLTAALLNRRSLPAAALGTTTGAGALAAFNYLYFGNVLNQTILAKSVAYHPSHALTDIATHAVDLLAGSPTTVAAFNPLTTHFGNALGWVMAASLVAVTATALRPTSANDEPRLLRVCLGVMALAMPACYVVGGIIFPWYLWPWSFLGTMCIAAFAVERVAAAGDRARFWAITASALALALVVFAQWVSALKLGTEERQYRASVGRFIGAHSAVSDDLLLEPLGYIPFFAERVAHDEVGLAAPEVTRFRQRYGARWWVRYVQERRPSFLVERPHILDCRTSDGDAITKEGCEWLRANYTVIKVFKYDPRDYYTSPLLLWLMKLGTASDYVVLQRQPPLHAKA